MDGVAHSIRRMKSGEGGIEHRGFEVPMLSTLLYIVVFVLQCLLLFTRLRTKFCLRAEGIVILFAMVPTTFYYIATLISNDDFQWRRHMIDIEPEKLAGGLKIVMAAEVTLVLTCTLAKASIMQLIKREMSCASAFWRGTVILATTTVAIQGFVSLLLVVFQCGSTANYLQANRPACRNNSGKLVASTSLNTYTDILVILMSIPSMLSYQFSRKQKLIVASIYSLGLISLGAGISRAYFLYKNARQADLTWSYYPVWISSAVQLYFGMICSTLPTTNHFFSHYAPSLFGSLNFNADEDLVSQRHISLHSGGAISSGEEEMMDFEKNLSGTTLGMGKVIDRGKGVVTIETRGAQGLSAEDSEFIKITQQTTVCVSKV